MIRCYVSKEADFQLSKVLKSTEMNVHSREGREGFIYSSATCPRFSVEDIAELASSMEFELAQLWIQITPPGLSDEHLAIVEEQDSEKFFEAIECVILRDTNDIGGIECIGNVADGYKMVWVNPPVGGVEQVTENIRKWCQTLEFELTIAD